MNSLMDDTVSEEIRKSLWVLMAAGNLLSSFMSRQMEFDADLYELKLSGSDNFVAVGNRSIFGHDVKQQTGKAGIGKMSGDSRAHGARSKNSSSLNPKCH